MNRVLAIHSVQGIKKQSPSILYIILIIFTSLFYAGILTSIPVDVFMDRDNYIIYAKSYDVIFHRYHDSGLISILFNEPLWLLYNWFLSFFFIPEDTVRFTVFISAFITAYYTLKVKPSNFILLVLFLLYPQVLIKYTVHLRQGLAVAIFLIGYYSYNKANKTLFILLTPFIHLSFVFVLFIYSLIIVMRKMKIDVYLVLMSIFIIGLSISYLLPIIAKISGARQADEYMFDMTNVSGFGFLFWAAILMVFLCQSRKFIEKNIFPISAMIFYLSTYFFIEVTGRIFESMLVIVLLSAVQLSNWRYIAFLSLFISLFLYSYYQKLGLPWLGWAV